MILITIVLRHPSLRTKPGFSYFQGEPGGVKLSLTVSFNGVDSMGTLSNIDLDLVTRLNSKSPRDTRLDLDMGTKYSTEFGRLRSSP